MQIELMIDGEKQIFTTPFIPMMAKRKFLEIQANAEEREDKPTSRELLEEDNEIMSILTDIIFQKQFTLDDLFNGASQEYIDAKLQEGVFGIKPKKGNDKGNEKGE